MKLIVENYLGIKNAKIDLKSINLICGKNGNGKSSLLDAISSSILGSVKTTKKDGKLLLHNDNPEGKVVLYENDNLFVEYSLPSCKIEKTGDFKLSEMSAERENFSALSVKEKMVLIEKHFKINITEADIQKALPNLLEKETKNLTASIQQKGIDVVYANTKEATTKAKGVWESITGEKYGSDKAKNWKPKTISFIKKIEELNEKLIEKKAFVDIAKTEVIINKSEVERLKKIIFSSEKAICENQNLKDRQEIIKKELTVLQDFNRSYSIESDLYCCPQCKTKLILKDGKLTNDGIKSITKEIKKQIEDNKTEIRKLTEELDSITNKISDNFAVIRSAESASEALNKITAKSKSYESNVTQETVEKLEFELIQIQSELDGHKKYFEAKSQHEKIEKYTNITKVLAPDGLKKDKIEEQISDINQKIKAISTEWNIEINQDLEVLFEKRYYKFLSVSEKYRVDSVLRLLFCTLEQDDFVFFDGMDVLDSENRKKMFKILLNIKNCIILIGMTYLNKEQVPVFKNPAISTYWLESGEIK